MNSSAWDSIYNIGYACLIMFYCAVKCTPVLRLNILYWACLCSLSFLSVWGYLQLCRFLPSPNPYFKVTGPFYHPTYLGLTLSALMCIVIHVIMFHILHRKYTKGLFIMESVCLLSAIPILIYTESRTAWFALIMSVILPYATRQIWGKYSIRKKVLVVTVATIFSSGLLIAFYTLKPISADGRLLIWKVGYGMIKDKPATGFGKGGFEANYLYYQAKYLLTENATEKEKYIAGNTHMAFNDFLRIGVEHGITGLVLYMAFIITLFGISGKKTLSMYISKSVLFLIVLQGLFSYPYMIYPVMAIGVVALALLSRGIRHFRSFNLPLKYINIFIAVAIISLTFLIYRKYAAYHEPYAGMKNNGYNEFPAKLKQLFPKLKEDNIFLTYYCKIMEKAGNWEELSKSISILEKNHPTPALFIQKGDLLQKKSLLEEAEKAYRLAADMVPSEQKARGRLAFLYKKMGKNGEAYELANILLTEKVKNYGFETFKLHSKLKKEFQLKKRRFPLGQIQNQ